MAIPMIGIGTILAPYHGPVDAIHGLSHIHTIQPSDPVGERETRRVNKLAVVECLNTAASEKFRVTWRSGNDLITAKDEVKTVFVPAVGVVWSNTPSWCAASSASARDINIERYPSDGAT